MAYLIKLIKKTYKMARPHERRTVLKNAASLTTLQAITYLLPLILMPYLFRVLGAAKFGLVAFAQALVQYFMIVTDYGFGISATKEISLCRHDRGRICEIFSAVMTAKLAFALLSLLILCLIVLFIPKFRADWMIYLLSFGAVIGNTLFPVWFFQGTEKMKHIADLNIAGGLIFAVCIFLLVRAPEDYLLVAVVNSGVFLFTGILGLYIVFHKFKVAFKVPGYKNLWKELAAGWNIFISNVAINAYTTTRIFAVGLLTNNSITGFYSMAEKISGVFQTFPLYSFTQAIFPRLSRIYRINKLKALNIMRHIQQITMLAALIFLPAVFALAHPIVRVACGGDYPQTVMALRFLIISVFFICSNAFRVQFLLVCGKTRLYSRIHITMAMIGLPLIFLLIHYFSYSGAAMATVLIESGIFLLTYFAVRRLKFSK